MCPQYEHSFTTYVSSGGFAVPIMCNALIGDYSSADDWTTIWFTSVGFLLLWGLVYSIFIKCEEAEFSIALDLYQQFPELNVST